MSSSFILHNNKPFLDLIVICDEKWIVYDNWRQPTQWLDWEKPPGHFLKPNLHQNKVMVTVWSFASDLIRLSFLNPGEIITSEKCVQQIDAMHQKLQVLQPVLVNRKGPILLYNDTQLQIVQSMFPKLNKLALKFCIIHHIHLTSYQLSLLQASWQRFAGKGVPRPVGGRKCFLKVHQILKDGFLWYRNKEIYFLLAKMCWLQWFLFWLIKMCLSLVIMI